MLHKDEALVSYRADRPMPESGRTEIDINELTSDELADAGTASFTIVIIFPV